MVLALSKDPEPPVEILDVKTVITFFARLSMSSRQVASSAKFHRQLSENQFMVPERNIFFYGL